MPRDPLKPPPGVRVIRQAGKIGIIAASERTGDRVQKVLMDRAQRYGSMLEYYKQAEKFYGFHPYVNDKGLVMRLGQFWWKKLYQGNEDDGLALSRYMDVLNTEAPEHLAETAQTEPDQIINLMSARWCEQAFPVVTMGEKYFAALCATHVPDEMLEDIQAPWRCFVIEIPMTLGVWDADEKKSVRITRIMVQRYHGGARADEDVQDWRWLAFTETGQQLWRAGTAAELVQPVRFREKEMRSYIDVEREQAFPEQLSHDQRLFDVIGRLVINVCLALSDPDNIKRVGNSHERHAKGRGFRGGPPEQRVFQLGRPVQVDCRGALQQYLGGKRVSTEVQVQFIVRGHWRNQPHGPKHTLRRRQWIEPFWKGPEDGPIPLRPHVLKDGEA